MLKITQKFKAHPIGQGFFYTGQLKTINSEFNFIFDCGSLSYSVLNDTIDRYRITQTQTEIDLLIISHFDADHVNGLKRLLNGRKVKKVVAPFISFEQRISIVLNFRDGFDQTIDNIDPDIDNTLLSMLDFTQDLKDELEGAEFYFIKGTDGNPLDPKYNDNIEKLANETSEFDFNFEGSEELSQEEINKLGFQNINKNLSKIECDKIGSINNGSVNVLDLIFYKKKIGEKENEFYNEVFNLFKNENKNSFKDITTPSTEELIETIKKYNGAKKIKDLFNKAASKVGIDLSITEITDLNTTALCMLHFDRLQYLRQNQRNKELFNRVFYEHVQLSNKKETSLPLMNSSYYPHRGYRSGYHWHSNTLLTADAFLKEEEDVKKFISHYNFYLDKISFFQIPHHGSRLSSDILLLSQINSRYLFINYGVDHIFIKKWSHPNDEVINNIIATGNSNKLIPVHEFSGYKTFNEFYMKL